MSLWRTLARHVLVGGACAVVAGLPRPAVAQVPAAAVVDEVFAEFAGTDVPGCAVGVSKDWRPVLARAYGMADLEHHVVNTPRTVFEPGSVSKQVTAAATVLLALDGKLSLDDDVREYIPELPDYGTTITIRHLLNHTSGLRDWGSIAGIEGWPRTSRVHTHRHVLDIAARQRSLNYEPGEYYSYTNTGYNLQAVLVERVSGMSFAEFSRRRIFEPLGMTRTQWRDDFTRVVEDRAIAYSPGPDGYRMNMPFENVHGNGGLLTTVDDLLRFTHNLETGHVGGPELVREMHTRGVLDSGREISYASGLFVGEYKGVREVQHSGSTAGYRGFLTRFPDQRVAVAVMCNAANANTGLLAHRVADLYLGDALTEDGPAQPPPSPVALSPDRIERLIGLYRRARDLTPIFDVTYEDRALSAGGVDLTPMSDTRFFAAQMGATIEFAFSASGTRPTGTVYMRDGDEVRIEPVERFEPTVEELGEYAGVYRSDEAEAEYRIEIREGALFRVDRYGEAVQLRPFYPDGFRSSEGDFIVFRRAGGAVSAYSSITARVWDLRFQRVGG